MCFWWEKSESNQGYPQRPEKLESPGKSAQSEEPCGDAGCAFSGCGRLAKFFSASVRGRVFFFTREYANSTFLYRRTRTRCNIFSSGRR